MYVSYFSLKLSIVIFFTFEYSVTCSTTFFTLLYEKFRKVLLGSWLRGYSDTLPKRQELPDGAAWDAATLMEMPRPGEDMPYNLEEDHVPFVALSYCWASPGHPDPAGSSPPMFGSRFPPPSPKVDKHTLIELLTRVPISLSISFFKQGMTQHQRFFSQPRPTSWTVARTRRGRGHSGEQAGRIRKATAIMLKVCCDIALFLDWCSL